MPQTVNLPRPVEGSRPFATVTPTADDTAQPTPRTPFALDASFTIAADPFDWQWDDALDLDASFSWKDLGTYDAECANPSIPWLPLRQLGSPVAPNSHNSQDPSRQATQLPGEASDVTVRGYDGKTMAQPPSTASAFRTSAVEIPRDALASSLMQPLPDTTLPPTQFLNRCIQTYTTRLWPLIPVVHLPTFQPARTNPLLLLSICSLGALAEGSKSALYHADRLYEGVQKAILVSFSPKLVGDEQALAILQAAAIGQTFALLSGQRSHLLLAECFHGTLGVSMRGFYDFVLGKTPTPLQNAHDSNSPAVWHEWIRAQTVIRLLNSSYIHNGEISSIVHRPAHLRVQPSQIALAEPDSLFLAKSHAEWAELKAWQSTSRRSSNAIFSSCAMLGGFITEIGHFRSSPFSNTIVLAEPGFHSHLVEWIEKSHETLLADGSHRLSPLILWHSCFIILFSNIDGMESACDTSDNSIRDQHIPQLQEWASSKASKQCVLHARSIYKRFERFQLCDAPAIHVARCLWHAGLIMAVYSSFGAKNSICEQQDCSPSFFPEFCAARQAGVLSEDEWTALTHEVSAEQCKTIAYSISRMLRHLGPWLNAAKWSAKLDHVLEIVDD